MVLEKNEILNLESLINNLYLLAQIKYLNIRVVMELTLFTLGY